MSTALQTTRTTKNKANGAMGRRGAAPNGATSPETPISCESGDTKDDAKSQQVTQTKARQRVMKTQVPPEWFVMSPLAPKPGDVVFCS